MSRRPRAEPCSGPPVGSLMLPSLSALSHSATVSAGEPRSESAEHPAQDDVLNHPNLLPLLVTDLTGIIDGNGDDASACQSAEDWVHLTQACKGGGGDRGVPSDMWRKMMANTFPEYLVLENTTYGQLLTLSRRLKNIFPEYPVRKTPNEEQRRQLFRRLCTITEAYRSGVLRLTATTGMHRSVRAFVLAAVQQDGHALEHASEELRANRAVVLAAVQQNGSALEFASEELRGDRAVVLAAVAQNGKALDYASEGLQNDRAVWAAAAAVRGTAAAVATAAPRVDEVG